MEYKVNVRVSNRHVHLTKETFEKLFDGEIEKDYDLNQIGEFASKQFLTINYNGIRIPNVRVLGQFRDYNQVEISKRDARGLKCNPPVRSSGVLDDALFVTLETPKGSVTTKALILADRHVHMSPDDAIKYGVLDKQKVKVRIPGDKSGVMDAVIKVGTTGYYEFHVDTDDANAFLIEDNDEVTLII